MTCEVINLFIFSRPKLLIPLAEWELLKVQLFRQQSHRIEEWEIREWMPTQQPNKRYFVSICNCTIGEFQNLQYDIFGKNGVHLVFRIVYIGYCIGFGTYDLKTIMVNNFGLLKIVDRWICLRKQNLKSNFSL